MGKIFSNNVFRAFMPLIDLLIIWGTNVLCFLYFKDNLDNLTINFYSFESVLPFVAFAYLVLARVFDLEKPKDFSFFGIAYTISIIVIILLIFTMAISFYNRQFAYPRSILLASSALQIFFISLWYWFANKMYQQAIELNKVLIIGEKRAKELAYKLLQTRTMWSNVKDICYHKSDNLEDYINKCDVAVITEDVSEDRKQNIIKLCIEKGKKTLYEPKNKEILLFNASMLQVDDSPMLDVRELGIQTGAEAVKRIVDVVVAVLGVLIFIIPTIIVYLSLKISGGSAFYTQIRVTRGGKHFKIYKFRTMIENAEAKSGPMLAQDTDSRITRFGQFLRATRLDEVPQIFNVLKGDMSIVGPRPERPFFVEQFSEELPEYNLRHRVKAGLTGLAQVQGRYNTSARDKLKYDLLYINAYSLMLDTKLILQTLNILLRRDSTQGVKSHSRLESEVEELWRP